MIEPVYATAWLASLMFFSARMQLGSRAEHWFRIRRLLNRLGVLVLWSHIVLAYWLTHDGSHAAAIAYVAERTEQIIGIRNGLGIYANFLVAVLWTGSAFHLPRVPRSQPIQLLIEIFLWLMVVSASILFAQPLSAIVFTCIAVLVLLSIMMGSGKHDRRERVPDHSSR